MWVEAYARSRKGVRDASCWMRQEPQVHPWRESTRLCGFSHSRVQLKNVFDLSEPPSHIHVLAIVRTK